MKLKSALAPALALTLLLSGCGGAGKSADVSYAGSSTGSSFSGGSLNLAPNAPAEKDMWLSEVLDQSQDAAEVKDVDLAEKLIYSANITVETLEFDAAVASLNTLAGSLGGFIQSSDISGHTNHYADGSTKVVDRSASYVLRVPAGRFQQAVTMAGELGSVTNTYTAVDNITSSFTDQDARKHSLEVQEERLLAMLEKAEDVQVLVELENRLADVRYEIESIERTLRNWQQQVDYSTISILLREVAVYTPTASIQRTFGEQLSDALRDGWSGFLEMGRGLILFLARSLPGLILLAVVIPLVLPLLRKLRARRKERKRKTKGQTEDSPS